MEQKKLIIKGCYFSTDKRIIGVAHESICYFHTCKINDFYYYDHDEIFVIFDEENNVVVHDSKTRTNSLLINSKYKEIKLLGKSYNNEEYLYVRTEHNEYILFFGADKLEIYSVDGCNYNDEKIMFERNIYNFDDYLTDNNVGELPNVKFMTKKIQNLSFGETNKKIVFDNQIVWIKHTEILLVNENEFILLNLSQKTENKITFSHKDIFLKFNIDLEECRIIYSGNTLYAITKTNQLYSSYYDKYLGEFTCVNKNIEIPDELIGKNIISISSDLMIQTEECYYLLLDNGIVTFENIIYHLLNDKKCYIKNNLLVYKYHKEKFLRVERYDGIDNIKSGYRNTNIYLI